MLSVAVLNCFVSWKSTASDQNTQHSIKQHSTLKYFVQLIPLSLYMKKNAPTIKEIAKMLNLSLSTVSRALNNSTDISPATTKRVKDVALELGYEPNQTA